MKFHFVRLLTLTLAIGATHTISVHGAEASPDGSQMPQLLFIGPVEGVGARGRSVRVLGHRLSVRISEHLQPGENINVYGAIRSDGSIWVSNVFRAGQHVPGSSRVLLTGAVEAVNSSIGRARVGGVEIDLNVLESIELIRNARVAIQIIGIQPNPSGIVIAETISLTGMGSLQQGISDGSVQGISGGSTSGISGGSVQGISGGSRD